MAASPETPMVQTVVLLVSPRGKADDENRSSAPRWRKIVAARKKEHRFSSTGTLAWHSCACGFSRYRLRISHQAPCPGSPRQRLRDLHAVAALHAPKRTGCVHGAGVAILTAW